MAGRFAAALVLVAVLVAGVAQAANDASSITFAVFGDWGWGPDGIYTYLNSDPTILLNRVGQKQVAAQMQLQCAIYNCDFMLNVGDNFYDVGVSSTTDAQWTSSYTAIYTGANLLKNTNTGATVKIYSMLGNHDYGNVNITGACSLVPLMRRTNTQSAAAQWKYTSVDPTGRWYMASPGYYNTRLTSANGATSVTLTVMDTEPFVKKDYATCPARYGTGKYGAAGNWTLGNDGTYSFCKYSSAELIAASSTIAQTLQTTLTQASVNAAACASTWSVMAGHHPVVSASGTVSPLSATVGTILTSATKQPHAWFNGHDHILGHIAPPSAAVASGGLTGYQGVTTNFFATGSSGVGDAADTSGNSDYSVSTYGKYLSGNNGFAIVTATATTFKVDLFDLGASPACIANIGGAYTSYIAAGKCGTTYVSSTVAMSAPSYTTTLSNPYSACTSGATGTPAAAFTGTGTAPSVSVGINFANLAASGVTQAIQTNTIATIKKQSSDTLTVVLGSFIRRRALLATSATATVTGFTTAASASSFTTAASSGTLAAAITTATGQTATTTGSCTGSCSTTSAAVATGPAGLVALALAAVVLAF